MLGPIALRIAPYAAVAVLAGVTGWKVNGWRLEARISDLKASYLKDYAEAEKSARNREKELTEAAAQIRRQKDEQIARINSELWITLDGVRQRPSIHDLPADTTLGQTAQGCYPAELFREHAEMALREAARADTIMSALNSCYLQYDSLRP
jgi:hypothetical protein